MSSPADPIPPITLQWHDPLTQQVTQTWRFAGQGRVRVGRGDDCDVAIPLPYVSRLHAELYYRAGVWELVNVGRNGCWVAGQNVASAMLGHMMVFRLGDTGPALRLVLEAAAAGDDPMGTIAPLAPASAFGEGLTLDAEAVRRQVAEIADDSFFQNLQQRVRERRPQPPTDLSPPNG